MKKASFKLVKKLVLWKIQFNIAKMVLLIEGVGTRIHDAYQYMG